LRKLIPDITPVNHPRLAGRNDGSCREAIRRNRDEMKPIPPRIGIKPIINNATGYKTIPVKELDPAMRENISECIKVLSIAIATTLTPNKIKVFENFEPNRT
jgi:hypothetical protein